MCLERHFRKQHDAFKRDQEPPSERLHHFLRFFRRPLLILGASKHEVQQENEEVLWTSVLSFCSILAYVYAMCVCVCVCMCISPPKEARSYFLLEIPPVCERPRPISDSIPPHVAWCHPTLSPTPVYSECVTSHQRLLSSRQTVLKLYSYL